MRRYFTLSGGLIALICFFLPWGNTQCEGKTTSSSSFPFSGFSLASFSWDWTFLWIVMVLAVFIIVLAALKPEGARIPVLIGSIAGLALMPKAYLRYVYSPASLKYRESWRSRIQIPWVYWQYGRVFTCFYWEFLFKA